MKRTLFLTYGRRSGADAARRRSHYRLLGVDPEAETFVIEAAYRALMRRAHPDRGGDTSRAQALNEAFGVLRDPASRARYDLALASRRAPDRDGAEAPKPLGRPARDDRLASNVYLTLGVVLVVAGLVAARHPVPRDAPVAIPFSWDAPATLLGPSSAIG